MCNNKEFQCDNGFCVHNSWLCNGRDDCGDRSDEVLQLCIDRSESASYTRTTMQLWFYSGVLSLLKDYLACGGVFGAEIVYL